MPVYFKGNRISKTLQKKPTEEVKVFDKPGQKKAQKQNQNQTNKTKQTNKVLFSLVTPNQMSQSRI